MSVPNQKKIIIQKTAPTPPFVQLNEREMIKAFCVLTRCAFGLYLYLAKSADGYTIEFSPQAIANLGLMSKGTASKAMQELEAKGYVRDGIFYTSHIDDRERDLDNIEPNEF